MALNNCVFIGRLVRDVECKSIGENVKVANFTIAVDKKYKPKTEGQATADYIPVTVWRKAAEFAEKYFHKGKQVYVSGSLETYKWIKDDVSHNGFRINAVDIGFADSARASGDKPNSNNPGGDIDNGFPPNDGFMPMDSDFGDNLPF